MKLWRFSGSGKFLSQFRQNDSVKYEDCGKNAEALCPIYRFEKAIKRTKALMTFTVHYYACHDY